MRRVGAAVVVATCLAIAACGGGGGSKAASSSTSSTSSSASSSASGDTFCASARTIISSLGGNAFTDPRGVQRILGQIETLTPPAAIAAHWPAFLDYARRLAAIGPRDPDAASKALDVLGQASADVTSVVSYLVDTCKIESAASDLSDLSDLSPRG